MKVLFVYSSEVGFLGNRLLDGQGRMQFGISYISAFLKKSGHQTELVVLSKLFGGENIKIVREYINKVQPGIICFTAVASEYDFIASIAKYIKRHYPDIYLLVGGPRVSLDPDGILSDSFDALCIGEGERPTLELISQLEKKQVPSHIPNIWIKHNSKIEKNQTREFLKELDTLPFPDRKMWQKWMDKKAPEKCTIVLSRGCPFKCSYCCNHALRTISPGTYVRQRSPENITEEIKGVLAEFPTIKEIYLETETINANIDWCIKLCSELERFNATLIHPISFGTNMRIIPNVDFENICCVLRKANFKFIAIGLESGSERVRREILNKNFSNEDVIRYVEVARKYGLKVLFYNLIGIPGETFDDFKETVKLNKICKPDWFCKSIYFPFPGTELYLYCKKQGLLRTPIDTRNVTSRAVLDLPGFSRKKIQLNYYLFDLYLDKDIEPVDSWLILFRSFHYLFYKWIKRIYRNIAIKM